jgi:hypothetical protein
VPSFETFALENALNVAEGVQWEMDAFSSSLKLPSAGYQSGNWYNPRAAGNYWSSGANANGNASAQFLDINYQTFLFSARVDMDIRAGV